MLFLHTSFNKTICKLFLFFNNIHMPFIFCGYLNVSFLYHSRHLSYQISSKPRYQIITANDRLCERILNPKEIHFWHDFSEILQNSL